MSESQEETVSGTDYITALVGSVPTSASTGPHKDVVLFMQNVRSLVAKELAALTDDFGVEIESVEYLLPFNWLITKFSNRDTVTQEDRDNLLTQVQTKIRYDLLQLAVQKVKMKAVRSGDYDIDI